MANKHKVKISSKKCVGCGLCVKDCVAGAIKLEEGKAVVQNPSCIYCGHCEAICPQNAVIVTGFSEESIPFEEQTRLDPEELLLAIKTRRSIRQFRNTPVPEIALEKILEAGRLAPTGGNAQNTGYVVLGSAQNELESLAVSMFRKAARIGQIGFSFLKGRTFDDQFFFKGAPLVIVITGNAINASLAAENMAFMAEAQGLGVLYSGFFTMCANHDRKIRKLMKLGKREKAVTTLVIGYPAVKYHRTAKREPARVTKL